MKKVVSSGYRPPTATVFNSNGVSETYYSKKDQQFIGKGVSLFKQLNLQEQFYILFFSKQMMARKSLNSDWVNSSCSLVRVTRLSVYNSLWSLFNKPGIHDSKVSVSAKEGLVHELWQLYLSNINYKLSISFRPGKGGSDSSIKADLEFLKKFLNNLISSDQPLNILRAIHVTMVANVFGVGRKKAVTATPKDLKVVTSGVGFLLKVYNRDVDLHFSYLIFIYSLQFLCKLSSNEVSQFKRFYQARMACLSNLNRTGSETSSQIKPGSYNQTNVGWDNVADALCAALDLVDLKGAAFEDAFVHRDIFFRVIRGVSTGLAPILYELICNTNKSRVVCYKDSEFEELNNGLTSIDYRYGRYAGRYYELVGHDNPSFITMAKGLVLKPFREKLAPLQKFFVLFYMSKSFPNKDYIKTLDSIHEPAKRLINFITRMPQDQQQYCFQAMYKVLIQEFNTELRKAASARPNFHKIMLKKMNQFVRLSLNEKISVVEVARSTLNFSFYALQDTTPPNENDIECYKRMFPEDANVEGMPGSLFYMLAFDFLTLFEKFFSNSGILELTSILSHLKKAYSNSSQVGLPSMGSESNSKTADGACMGPELFKFGGTLDLRPGTGTFVPGDTYDLVFIAQLLPQRLISSVLDHIPHMLMPKYLQTLSTLHQTQNWAVKLGVKTEYEGIMPLFRKYGIVDPQSRHVQVTNTEFFGDFSKVASFVMANYKVLEGEIRSFLMSATLTDLYGKVFGLPNQTFRFILYNDIAMLFPKEKRDLIIQSIGQKTNVYSSFVLHGIYSTKRLEPEDLSSKAGPENKQKQAEINSLKQEFIKTLESALKASGTYLEEQNLRLLKAFVAAVYGQSDVDTKHLSPLESKLIAHVLHPDLALTKDEKAAIIACFGQLSLLIKEVVNYRPASMMMFAGLLKNSVMKADRYDRRSPCLKQYGDLLNDVPVRRTQATQFMVNSMSDLSSRMGNTFKFLSEFDYSDVSMMVNNLTPFYSFFVGLPLPLLQACTEAIERASYYKAKVLNEHLLGKAIQHLKLPHNVCHYSIYRGIELDKWLIGIEGGLEKQLQTIGSMLYSKEAEDVQRVCLMAIGGFMATGTFRESLMAPPSINVVFSVLVSNQYYDLALHYICQSFIYNSKHEDLVIFSINNEIKRGMPAFGENLQRILPSFVNTVLYERLVDCLEFGLNVSEGSSPVPQESMNWTLGFLFPLMMGLDYSAVFNESYEWQGPIDGKLNKADAIVQTVCKLLNLGLPDIRVDLFAQANILKYPGVRKVLLRTIYDSCKGPKVEKENAIRGFLDRLKIYDNIHNAELVQGISIDTITEQTGDTVIEQTGQTALQSAEPEQKRFEISRLWRTFYLVALNEQLISLK